MIDVLHPASARVARVLYEKHNQPKQFIDAAEHVVEWWRKLGHAAICAFEEHEAEYREVISMKKAIEAERP